jgi:stage III sporulation protein AA
MDTKEILDILPQSIKDGLSKFSFENSVQEIRIKANKPVIFVLDGKEIISPKVANAEDLKIIMQKISNYSLYAFEEDIKQGYITIKGGHRVGICGKCILEGNSIKSIKYISSINIRISRAVENCSKKFIPYMFNGKRLLNTIIISPPKCGKTTVLRDLAKNISDGINSMGIDGRKVCIIDERSELAACYEGIPQMNVGMRTDVLDSCIKSEGIMMAIRSMSPDVIVCDEIGREEDMKSILSALSCGVNVITSIHGFGIEDLYKRFVFKNLIDNKVFDRAIVLSNRKGISTVEYIYDFNEKRQLTKEVT